MFQHTAARRRLENLAANSVLVRLVSTHSRPKAAGPLNEPADETVKVSTHSRPKAAGPSLNTIQGCEPVSTHSRPKAAGPFLPTYHKRVSCFNTQPPEGGWLVSLAFSVHTTFQHTAARRRLAPILF